MKLFLIAPSSGKWRSIGRHWLFNGKTFRFSMLSLLSVAAETPDDVDIRIIDEQIEDIPWYEQPDLAGITCMTALSPRAYEIADRYRRRGIPVVLGGMHPSFLSNEALRHADAVVIGEAEGIWQEVIQDAKEGKLRGIYQSKRSADLSNLKLPPNHLLKLGKYSTHAVQATRGCPHQCAFCAVSAFHHHEQHRRPIESIIQEVEKIPSRFFIFVDDNLTEDRDYVRELFKKLIPLNKLWITQSTLSITDDPELAELAAEAGCIGLFVGLESFSENNLGSVDKTCHRVDRYQKAIQLLHSYGIAVEAGIVFGFDGDDHRVFEKTLNILDGIEVDLIQASIFTPLPGTKQFNLMQNRIIDRNWSHYDFHHVVFEPNRLSAEALQAGHDWVTYEFYRPRKISKRLLKHAARPRGLATLPYVAAVNFAYFGRTRSWKIRGWDPALEYKDQTFSLPNEEMKYMASSI